MATILVWCTDQLVLQIDVWCRMTCSRELIFLLVIIIAIIFLLMCVYACVCVCVSVCVYWNWRVALFGQRIQTSASSKIRQKNPKMKKEVLAKVLKEIYKQHCNEERERERHRERERERGKRIPWSEEGMRVKATLPSRSAIYQIDRDGNMKRMARLLPSKPCDFILYVTNPFSAIRHSLFYYAGVLLSSLCVWPPINSWIIRRLNEVIFIWIFSIYRLFWWLTNWTGLLFALIGSGYMYI